MKTSPVLSFVEPDISNKELLVLIQNTIKPPESFIREPIVRERTGLATSTLYLRIRNGEFPKPLKLKGDGRMSVWISSEVDAWIAQQIEAHRAGESS